MKWQGILAVLTALALAATAADARPPRGKVRGKRQRDRIKHGVKTRSLTPREAARLAAEQRKIKGMAQDITSDGNVTPKEKALLDRAQDKASHHIGSEKHDAQGRVARGGWKTWSPGVNTRQRKQHFRIAHGIHSGSLTALETRRLKGLEGRIRRLEIRLKQDGKLTVPERKLLHHALNRASKAIFDLKHNQGHTWTVRPAIVSLIESDDFTEEDAEELLAQLRRLSEISRLLANAPLTDKQRAALEAEYAHLASQLFE
jgi:hypothetical protein